MELLIIERKIFLVRGFNVVLDLHLADLYGVPTKALKQAVKRNPERFPPDFMFELRWGRRAPINQTDPIACCTSCNSA